MASSSSSSSSSHLAFFLLSLLISASVANAAHHKAAAAPAPAADCSTVVMSLSDCLTFVENGSTTTKPEGACCSGLDTVLKTNADCLCQAFKSSAQMGIPLNVTKALTLPSACKLKTPPMSSCQLSMAPAGAPVAVGGSTALPPSEMTESAPAPSPVGGATPSNSAHAVAVSGVFSVGSLVAAMATLAVSSFY
ncbi:unnamed protein product [Linum tenue]|uniref:Bifunctional inhibitor/plant lipid transfer protein/seed storage helical domain-containing protein n=1 Tax=Linum tenue TaxID=586396 RepID=A0AAV0R712_9ROSI|nr:unnamed protein product [Linum tenue]